MQTVAQPYRAAVITDAHVFYPDGRSVAALPGLNANHNAILRAVDGPRWAAEVTIVVDGPSCTPAKVDGWTWTGCAAGGVWQFYRHRDGRECSIGVRPAMGRAFLGVLFDQDTDPGALAIILDRYNRATGTAWRGTCALTGLHKIRLTWGNARRQPRWQQVQETPKSWVGPLVWRRELNEHERSWGYVHTFDANNAYLGTAISELFSWYELEPTGARPFDPAVGGYWHVKIGPRALWWLTQTDRPPLLKLRRGADSAWMSTPYAKLLGQLGDPVEVLDSWTGVPPEWEPDPGGYRRTPVPHAASGRVLRSWGEELRDAIRTAEAQAGTLPATIAKAVKLTYKNATGAMQRPRTQVARPDWGRTIIEGWRATMFRTMLRVAECEGVWPVEVRTDALSYADCTARPVQLARTLGADLEPGPRRIGRYKLSETVATATWEARRG